MKLPHLPPMSHPNMFPKSHRSPNLLRKSRHNPTLRRTNQQMFPPMFQPVLPPKCQPMFQPILLPNLQLMSHHPKNVPSFNTNSLNWDPIWTGRRQKILRGGPCHYRPMAVPWRLELPSMMTMAVLPDTCESTRTIEHWRDGPNWARTWTVRRRVIFRVHPHLSLPMAVPWPLGPLETKEVVPARAMCACIRTMKLWKIGSKWEPTSMGSRLTSWEKCPYRRMVELWPPERLALRLILFECTAITRAWGIGPNWDGTWD
mmetsp:Transcript_25914/g.71340  ORF Transcript_25914/g.71340 Transcript_25914/m.71340 type:complete len:259 (-) Transcript_25914:1287-2063(-)